MYTRPITYENLDGEQVTENHSFHLTKAEAVEMSFSRKGGIEDYAKKIIETEEYSELIDLFKELILKTYGIREGLEFEKDPRFTKRFVNTGAYSELFIELASDSNAAIKFFRGIFPKDMQSRVDDAVSLEKKDLTDDELLTVSWDEFYAAAGGRDDKQWDKRYLLAAFRRKGVA